MHEAYHLPVSRLAFFTIIFLTLAALACHNSTGPDDDTVKFHVTLNCPDTSLRVSDSTTISASEDVEGSAIFTYEWHANLGHIKGSGQQIVYVAPDTVGTALVYAHLHNDSLGEAQDTISLFIYRQFVILKADDLKAQAGLGLSPRWERFLDYIVSRDLKAALGLIGNSLDNPGPAYLTRVQALCHSGQFEIWNHGYDHMLDTTTQSGTRLYEFCNTSYEHQTLHLLKTQSLAREKLGITLHAFGAPYDHYDQTATRVIDETDDIVVWLFGDPASTKLVLGRSAEIEIPVHNPDYEKFLQQYDPDQECLVFEIHPSGWDDTRFEQFVKIIDWLETAEVTFITPHEYYTAHQGGSSRLKGMRL